MLFKRFATVLLLSTLALKGDLLDDKIINLIGQENYHLHKNLIDEIRNDKNSLPINKDINFHHLLKTLKEKALLNTSLSEQTEITVIFTVVNSNKKGFKILKDVLSNIGYAYYFTDFIKNVDGNLVWQIHFKSDFALDPYSLSTELSQFQTSIIDINKISTTQWEYTINLQEGILYDVKSVPLDEKLTLPMPLEPYILSLSNVKELLIVSEKGNNWIPKISFYDKELNALGTIEMDGVYEAIKVSIPKNTQYAKISDRYTLLNLKRGLSILVSNPLKN